MTGILVTGTAQNPVLYVTSSDPRIGGGSNAHRQESRHELRNRLASDEERQSLEQARLGSRPAALRGEPPRQRHRARRLRRTRSTSPTAATPTWVRRRTISSFLPEYALSAAILSIDLDAIGNTTYDLPTLDDEDASNVCTLPYELRPRLHGNTQCDSPGSGNGVAHRRQRSVRRQQRQEPSEARPGRTGAGVRAGLPQSLRRRDHRSGQRMYTIDNGPNSGWGNMPVGEGPAATAPTRVSEPGVYAQRRPPLRHRRRLLRRPPQSDARAAPPTRSTPAIPQSPVADRQPGRVRLPHSQAPATARCAIFNESTNGITEYTTHELRRPDARAICSPRASTTRFGGSSSMPPAPSATSVTPLFSSSVGARNPLDVIAPRATDPFPGTSGWRITARQQDRRVRARSELDVHGRRQPRARRGRTTTSTTPTRSTTAPTRARRPISRPTADGDFVSDLNDPDDDNDGLFDTSDKFALDPNNGTTTSLPAPLRLGERRSARTAAFSVSVSPG